MAERTDKAEQRELEENATEMKEVLSQSIQIQENVQERRLYLETHSRRNNIWIFGIPEGYKGNNVQELVESIIKKELSLGDLDLKIQWCQGTRIKATHGCMLQVGGGIFPGIKDEGVAWRKKEVHCNRKSIFFDQDYPPEIQQKRKAFAPIRKIIERERNQVPFFLPCKGFYFLQEMQI